MPSPALHQHLRLGQSIEDLPLEQLVAQLAVEGLDVAVLPWASGLDEERPHAQLGQPCAHLFGGEFRPVIGADVLRHTPRGE